MSLQELLEKKEGVIGNALSEIVKTAYEAGYQQARSELGLNYTDVNNPEAEIEYVDLGLPSGTIWGLVKLKKNNHFSKKMTFPVAQKFNLPTQEEIQELKDHTRFKFGCNFTGRTTYLMYGPNGNSILLYDYTGCTAYERSCGIKVWLNEPLTSESEAKVAIIRDDKDRWSPGAQRAFSGDACALALVIKK